ncbi:MAG TPA: putative metallopeptidase [Candidatus Saccharimonadales bacterium]|nr:putative metallopeptidase [Candidatus Saccharimonadales bacterium]
MKWIEADEIKEDLKHILSIIDLSHVNLDKISCYRTMGSTSRSYARIWAFPKIFQQALQIEPHYVIEVLSKYYDRLHPDEQKKVLIHELLHIPKNFSGALVPHKTKTRSVTKLTNQLFKEYKKKIKDL